MVRQLLAFCGALAIFLAVLAARAADNDGQTNEDEKVLKEAKVPATDDGLCDFFRKLTPRDGDLKRVPDLIRQLGSEDFDARQQASERLIALGPSILPLLRKELDSADVETRTRVRACIEKLARAPSALAVTAAARVLRDRRPKDAVEVLLGYLPYAPNEEAENEAMMTVFLLGAKEGKIDERLARAIEDTAAARRAAASLALARWGDPQQKKRAQEALKDPDPKVRFHAAQGLLAAGEKAAMPALLDLLTDAPVGISQRSEGLLQLIAGDTGPTTVTLADDPAARKKCREAWDAWWKNQGGKVDLTKVQVGVGDVALAPLARDAIRKFLSSQDAAGLAKCLDDRINIAGLQIVTRDELVKTKALGQPPGETTIETIRSVKLTDAVDMQDALTRGFAESFAKQKVQAFYAEVTQAGQPQKLVFVVRLKGGRAQIAGVAPSK